MSRPFVDIWRQFHFVERLLRGNFCFSRKQPYDGAYSQLVLDVRPLVTSDREPAKKVCTYSASLPWFVLHGAKKSAILINLSVPSRSTFVAVFLTCSGIRRFGLLVASVAPPISKRQFRSTFPYAFGYMDRLIHIIYSSLFGRGVCWASRMISSMTTNIISP